MPPAALLKECPSDAERFINCIPRLQREMGGEGDFHWLVPAVPPEVSALLMRVSSPTPGEADP